MFSCGNINNIGFPFWGGIRPDGCGHRGLELNCDKNNVTIIKIRDVTYSVLNVNLNTQMLTITREDYLSGFCSPNFVNTTLDPTLFDFSLGYQNLTLAYGCALSSVALPGQLTCSSSSGLFDVHMELGAHGPENCNRSVVIPVPSNQSVDTLTWAKLEQSIKEGFDVKLKVDTSACSFCMGSKGVCGYDQKLNQSTCYRSQAKPPDKPGTFTKLSQIEREL